MNDHHIENIDMTTAKIKELRRQIQEVREEREIEKRQYLKLRNQYERQMEFGLAYFNWILNGNQKSDTQNHYIHIAISQYDFHVPFVIRKHAQLLQTTRSQQLLEIYIRILSIQNQELVHHLKNFKEDEAKKLDELKTTLIVTKNIALFYKAQSKRKCNKSRNDAIKKKILKQRISEQSISRCSSLSSSSSSSFSVSKTLYFKTEKESKSRCKNINNKILDPPISSPRSCAKQLAIDITTYKKETNGENVKKQEYYDYYNMNQNEKLSSLQPIALYRDVVSPAA